MDYTKRIANIFKIASHRVHIRKLAAELMATSDKETGRAITEAIKKHAVRINELEKEQCEFAAENIRQIFSNK